MTKDRIDLNGIDEGLKESLFEHVENLVDGEFLAAGPNYQNINTNNRDTLDKTWEEISNMIPTFKNNVLKLKNEILLGMKTLIGYNAIMKNAMARRFNKVENPFSNEMIILLASARIQQNPSKDPNSTVEELKSGLTNINSDWSQITSRDIIKAALLGEL